MISPRYTSGTASIATSRSGRPWIETDPFVATEPNRTMPPSTHSDRRSITVERPCDSLTATTTPAIASAPTDDQTASSPALVDPVWRSVPVHTMMPPATVTMPASRAMASHCCGVWRVSGSRTRPYPMGRTDAT